MAIGLTCMMTWVAKLAYPWCPAKLAMQFAPDVHELDAIRHYVLAGAYPG